MGMDQADAALEQPAIRISERARRRIGELIAAEGGGAMMFRIAVSAGGCSGFQYGFSLDDARSADDRTFVRDGVTVVVDEVSLGLLAGAELDYVEELIGAHFTINNPNASARCGCGSSFSV